MNDELEIALIKTLRNTMEDFNITTILFVQPELGTVQLKKDETWYIHGKKRDHHPNEIIIESGLDLYTLPELIKFPIDKDYYLKVITPPHSIIVSPPSILIQTNTEIITFKENWESLANNIELKISEDFNRLQRISKNSFIVIYQERERWDCLRENCKEVKIKKKKE